MIWFDIGAIYTIHIGVNVESFMFHIATDESLDVWRSSPTLLTFFFNLGNNS